MPFLCMMNRIHVREVNGDRSPAAWAGRATLNRGSVGFSQATNSWLVSHIEEEA